MLSASISSTSCSQNVERWILEGLSDRRNSSVADVEVRFDPNQLNQVIDNLIANASNIGGETAASA